MTNKICQKFLHLILFIFSFLLLWTKTTSSTSISHRLVQATARYKCIDNERDALLDFKAHLQDPNGNLSTWTIEKEEDYECCKWNGVTCNNRTGHVTELNLSSYSLGGKISHSLVNLSYLIYLNLSYNYFSGVIPPELGSLPYLQYLSLGNLTSCIVDNIDWLSHMSDLIHLNMDDISLAKANSWVNVILGLQNLSYLSLSRCDLSQVMHPYSSSFLNSSTSSIDTLYLNDNNLNSSMYHWLWPLTSNKLRYLDLSKNMLDGKSFGYLCSLTNLDFSYNSVVANLPDFLNNNWSGCTSVALQTLHASYSRFTGVPSEADMPNLSYVYDIGLSSCNLGPLFPRWIQSLKKLTRLNIAKNGISDTIPVEFWNIWPSQLTNLNLSANNISGEVHDLVSNFSPYLVSTIDLSSNNFYGHIAKVPSTLASLDLSRNKFHGGISFLCQISYEFLTDIDLSRNSFSGKLPDCLWNFEKLKVLNLGSNNLSGKLPASVYSFISLEVLSLYNNNLFGELPSSLKSCTMLTFLDLGANKFTGNVPLWIGESLSRLYVLSLTSNKLLGHIPLQLCQLANLQILDLSMNNLNGTIPSCLNNLTTMVQEGGLYTQNIHGVSNPVPGRRLVTSSLSYSALSPSHVVQSSPVVIYIDHAMIHWQGNMQEFTTNLGLLKLIDLSRNNLTGHIPYEVTNLHGLISLNLSNNALYGKIPWKIGEMGKLLALDLSRNNLSGEIPSSMSRMNSIDYLDLSYNNLSGRIPTSTQLQSFEPSKYTGNAKLCGLPLTKYCPGDESSEVPPVIDEKEDDGKEMDDLQKWFYIGSATGFPMGFWIVCGSLFLNRRARHAFFNFKESLQDMVYLKVVVFVSKLKRFACK